jgi:hypothetical protein
VQKVDIPVGAYLSWAAGFRQRFWLLCYASPNRYLVSSDGTVYGLPPGYHPRSDQRILVDLPGRPGPTFVQFTAEGTVGVHGLTGEQTTIDAEPFPVTSPGRAGRLAADAWVAERYAAHALPVFGSRSRVAADDRVVVMTGSAALAVAEIVMGPSAARGVIGTRGLARGHVVTYGRASGSSRVMRLPDRLNALWVFLAEDGLTFLAAGRYAAFVIDIDV